MNEASSSAGTIAYFSMDVAVDSAIPTYSGGLGVLAGDTLRSAADLQIPIVAVSLLHRKGYFNQRLDSLGNQLESPSKWSPEDYLTRLPVQISLSLEGRQVRHELRHPFLATQRFEMFLQMFWQHHRLVRTSEGLDGRSGVVRRQFD